MRSRAEALLSMGFRWGILGWAPCAAAAHGAHLLYDRWLGGLVRGNFSGMLNKSNT